MDVNAHYSQPRWWKRPSLLGPLTDRRIAAYARRGYYQRRGLRLRQADGNQLVYSA
jgi:hypothetical protein